MNHLALAVVMLLADDGPNNSGPDFGKASPFGLLVIVLLLLGTFGLVWSMNRQLKKVPASFDTEDSAPDQAADSGTSSAGNGVRDMGSDGHDRLSPD